ncbi:contactin-5-like [Haliotis cracherodii]|uniref:contactin-5-like n=1 Tax=Haliotis cracherodii TaxID=6455 RepID=UPI0039EC49FA
MTRMQPSCSGFYNDCVSSWFKLLILSAGGCWQARDEAVHTVETGHTGRQQLSELNQSVMMLRGSLTILLVFVIKHTGSSQPTITEPRIRETQYPLPRKEFQLPCVADGDRPLRYTWLKNEVQLDPKLNRYLSVSENGTLTFLNFNSRENGNYTCKALNDDGYDISPAVTLIGARLATQWDVPETEMAKSSGEHMSLDCKNPPYSAPPPTFVWSFSRSQDSAGQDVSLDNRVTMDGKGTLHFAFVKISDGGFYKCGIFNSRLDTRKLGSPVKVSVGGSGVPSQIEPRVIWHSKETTAVLGTEVKLECIFSGKPVPVVTWTRGGKDITMLASKDDNPNGGVLRISSVQENDEGSYECAGSNPAGTKHITIKLTIVSAPLWVDAPNSQVVLEGDNVTFLCKARAVGATSDMVTSWADGDAKMIISSDKSQVKFRNVSMGDNGCVHCTISNNIDYISKTACFKVVNDSSELPPTTSTTREVTTTQRLPGKAHSPDSGSASNGALVAIVVVMLILGIVATVGFVLWRRRQQNRVTFRVKKGDKETFEEKAKRRQTL